MNCSRFYIVLFLFISTLSVFGQKKFRFNNYNERDGIPSVFITNIVKDSLGVMWFGSSNGLFSYDGYEFVSTWKNKNMESSNNFIRKGINKIWAYNYNLQNENASIKHIDLSNYNIEEIKLPDHFINIDFGKEDNYIKDIYQINSNCVLFISNNYLYSYSLKSTKLDSVELNKHIKNNFSLENDFQFTDCKKRKMIFYNYGFIEFDETLESFEDYKFSSNDSSEFLIDVNRHNTDTLIVMSKGTSHSFNFYYFIESSGVFEYWLTCDSERTLHYQRNWTTFTKNKKNEIFIKNAKSIMLFKPTNNDDTIYTDYQSNSFKIEEQADAFYTDIHLDNNILWLASGMYGIYTLNLNKQNFNTIRLDKLWDRHLNQEDNIKYYNLHNAIEYNDTYFATTALRGVLNYDPSSQVLNSIHPTKIVSEPIYSGSANYYLSKHTQFRRGSFLISKNNDLWCAHSRICKFNNKTNEFDILENSNGQYRAIIEDNNENLWFSKQVDGITKFNPKTQEYTNYKYGESDLPCLSNTISDFNVKDSILYMGTTTVGIATLNTNSMTFSSFGKEHSPTVLAIDIINDSIWASSWHNGILCYDIYSGELLDSYTTKDGLPSNSTTMIKIDNTGNLWATSNHGLIYINTKNRLVKVFNEEDGIIDDDLLRADKFINENKNGELMMAYGSNIYTWDPQDFELDTTNPNIYFITINYFDGKGSVNQLLNTPYNRLKNNQQLSYDQNNITFEFSAIHFSSKGNIEFAYRLKGLKNEWNYSKQRRIEYSRLAPGTYTFEVKAANSDGVWCKPISFTFTIIPPFWITWWFISICIVLLLLSIYLLITIRTKQLKSRQLQLQQTVKERTKELAIKHEESENNRLLAEEKNKEIIDSINYAKRLQDSILPYETNINQMFPEAFILFRPKDIVSGDFYWFKQLKDLAIIAAVDCTGHGVPGAFMSFIGANGLNAATDEKQLNDTSEILNHLNESVHKALNKEKNQGYIRDGMDLTICSFNLKNLSLQFSGAKNSIYQIRNEELIQHSGDEFAIGSFSPGTKNYKSQNITLEKGDTIYLFSDGYPDQFGGIKGKKFMYKQFRQKLVEFSNLSMKNQKTKLEQTMDAWMGSHEQIDDILVIGIKI